VNSTSTSERRQFQRLTRPFEATWQGASGASPCRIADISWGGCFLQTLAEPTTRERVYVTFSAKGKQMSVAGIVVYVEHGMGFAVQFDPLTPDQVDSLKEILRDLL
jgi:hypothetical protein